MGRRGVVIPVGRLKLIDGLALAARLSSRLAEAGAAKAASLEGERRASWARAMARLEVPRGGFDKLPLRAVRAATRRLFGAFKRLGPLKRGDDSATLLS